MTPDTNRDRSARRKCAVDTKDTFKTVGPAHDQMFQSPQKQPIAKDDYMMESSAKKGPRDRSRSRTVSACSSPFKLNATRVCFRPQILFGAESDTR